MGFYIWHSLAEMNISTFLSLILQNNHIFQVLFMTSISSPYLPIPSGNFLQFAIEAPLPIVLEWIYPLIEHGGSFHRFFYVYQRISSPNQKKMWIFPSFQATQGHIDLVQMAFVDRCRALPRLADDFATEILRGHILCRQLPVTYAGERLVKPMGKTEGKPGQDPMVKWETCGKNDEFREV